MQRLLPRIIKKTFKLLLWGAVSAACFVLAFLIIYSKTLPDLAIWHTTILETEFTSDSEVQTFEDYLKQEDRVFTELHEKIIRHVPEKKQTRLNRFTKDSLSDPDAEDVNWNRSFVLETPAPKAGIIALHGMSDAPYSLKNLGEALNSQGAFVVGLRLPGHGTAPSGMQHVRLADMTAAIRLAVEYTARKVKDRPLYILGYSTGAALGLEYALNSLDDPQAKKISGIVMISPAIGVAKAAALAQVLEAASLLPGLEKLAWTDIVPEYNPYKYNSFSANAGNQVFQLTKTIRRLMTEAQKDGNLDQVPNILAFQSITDATVSTAALVEDLFLKLPKKGHELVVFDINRTFDLQSLIRKDPVPAVHNLLKASDLTFNLSFVSNIQKKTRELYIQTKKTGQKDMVMSPMNLAWPAGIYSLSHVALPFPDDDPIYGIPTAKRRDQINLGNIPLKGEKGILTIPPAEFSRLKYNPFYDYMEKSISDFIFPAITVD